MNLQIYNTLTKKKEPFEPLQPPRVGIYLCGPTVYDKAHIGHMVGPVIFDTVKRYLSFCGFEVTWVVNVTDVDDKLIKAAQTRGISMAEVAKENTADYLQNLAALGVDQIDHMPTATDSMPDIIAFVEALIEQGFAYEANGDVFFDVAKDADYGKLSNRRTDEQQGEGGDAASRKRSAADFALWKAAKPGEPSWDSPWGKGRPGWHIECSAMSRNILGESFDIHGGGLDLVFPHHENEIAQSECCHGQPMARYWMHNGLMKAASAGKVGGRAEREAGEQATVDTKISRSKGAGGLADLIAKQGGERIRFFLLRTHYRSTIVFSEEAIAEAGVGLETFHRFFERYGRLTGESFYQLAPNTKRDAGDIDAGDDPLLQLVQQRRNSFLAKMDDDFNSGAALGDLFELVRALNKFIDEQKLDSAGNRQTPQLAALRQGVATLRELSAILGIFRAAPQAATGGDDELVGKLMDLLIQLRTTSRANKDFAMADTIRNSLSEIGITLEDRKDGTGWRLD